MKLVDDKIGVYDGFDGLTLDQIREMLKDFEKECIKKGAIGEIRMDYEYYGYDGGYGMFLKFKREETEKEREKRLKMEERERERKRKIDDKKREKELKELERLKKKYEKG